MLLDSLRSAVLCWIDWGNKKAFWKTLSYLNNRSVSKQPTCCQVGFLWPRQIHHTIKNPHVINQTACHLRVERNCHACFILPVAEKLPSYVTEWPKHALAICKIGNWSCYQTTWVTLPDEQTRCEERLKKSMRSIGQAKRRERENGEADTLVDLGVVKGVGKLVEK